MTYALDSNTISYLLRDEGGVRKLFQQEIIEANNSYAIPSMSVFEVKRWLLDNPTKITRAYIAEFNVLFEPVKDKAELSLAVWEKATEIYIALKQKGQLIGDIDILIAAYCLINGYTLVTRNKKDFERIDSLKFVTWFE
ncbi:MAG: PIN domain-containing protein [Oscillospiraceae bacterium]|nr:PIN domain-containing protein [Oscillospiraceae bacterium]